MAIETAPPEDVSPADYKRHRERRRLWRLSAWGGTAAIALGALAIASQTEGASKRLQSAIALANQPERAVALFAATLAPQVAENNDAETKRLKAQVLALAADRDRLMGRLASLERNLDDLTGSIKPQAAAAPEPAAAPAARAVAMAPVIAPLAMPATTEAAATPWPGPQLGPTATPTPEPVPLPPMRLAAAPASEPAAEPPRKPELGIDLGGAPTMEILIARWAAVKANFGPLLAGLYPLAAHDRHPGAADYRLLLGPLANPAAAAQLCAHFAAARVTCRPAKFDGERMAQR